MKNQKNKLKEIWGELTKAETVLLFPHILVDGDGLGSSVALCQSLRDMGKEAYVVLEDKIPDNLTFLAGDCCTHNLNICKYPDVCVCIDCGDYDRFPGRKELFLKGKTTICIDHHRTSKQFCNFNFIDPEAAATGEIIYSLLEENKCQISKFMAEGIFAAIITDTGNFQYSNTTARTHEIVCNLYKYADSFSQIGNKIYESVPYRKIKLTGKLLDGIEITSEGAGAVLGITQETLKKTGTTMEDTEGTVSTLRSIDGVEIAAVIKEYSKTECKVSLRAKAWADVSKIAAKYNGGGHIKAAGFTLKMSFPEALQVVKGEITKALGK